MSETDPSTDPTAGPARYEIRIQGYLDPVRWSDWFEGLSITLGENGISVLSGAVVDQTALFGLLRKVRDLGMPLLSVRRDESAISGHGEGEHGAIPAAPGKR